MSTIIDIFEGLNDETKKIFDVIQKNGPITKNDLSLITGMKLTTLIRLMQPLEEAGLIVESRIGESTGGRKPVLYDVNTNKFYIVGIDISRIYTQIVITNLKMEVLDKYRFEMESSCSPAVTVNKIVKVLEASMEKINNDSRRLLGVGIGTVGPLDREKGIVINPVNFEAPGWENVSLKWMFEEKLRCPVILDNGANAAVLAETYFGAGKGLRNVVYFNCGVGIRTGAISSGSIIRTFNNSEDVFGHMVIDVDGEECSCGNYGCIECYSSILTITKKFISEIKKGRVTSIVKPVSQISYMDICKAAEKNDLLAKEILQSAAAILGTGLANFINLLNPSLVILSGPLVYHSEIFYQTCIHIASKKCYSNKENSIIFNRGGYFEENAISVGSAALVVENFLNRS
ncbi:MAG: transcriptional regulator [Clostridia bacterium]|nr:transcriptional regulator [Clostridia bacterium]